MTGPDFEDELRSALQELSEQNPPPRSSLTPEFWRRIATETPPRPQVDTAPPKSATLLLHEADKPVSRVQQFVALAVVAAIFVVVGLVFRNVWFHDRASVTPINPPSPTHSPSPEPTAAVCTIGPIIHLTRVPPPSGQYLDWQEPPEVQPAPWIPRRAERLSSPAFDVITEAGACIQAWRLPDGFVIPTDTQPIKGLDIDASTRANSDGLTEVYATNPATGATFLAVSGDLTPTDLATTLRAAFTRG